MRREHYGLVLLKESTDIKMCIRDRAYLADITFGTNNEFGFDYLRDNMAISPKDLVQRQHNYAIVDEDVYKRQACSSGASCTGICPRIKIDIVWLLILFTIASNKVTDSSL